MEAVRLIKDAETKDEVHQEDVEKDEVDSLYDQHINKPVKKEGNPEKFHETGLESAAVEDEDFVISYYKTVCEQLSQVPVAYFLHRIREPTIRMRYRGLGNEATKAIALALKESVTLERLDLSGNWIGPDGANSMARLLEENDYVTDVILSDNKMGSEGGQQIAKMLNINCGLRRLELSGNDFDDKCAQNFALAIENNKYLRELNLSHNRFTELGAEYLGQAIGSNENLDVLDLSWNHIREAGGIAIAKGLKENVRLKVCNLSCNGLGVKGGLALVDAMSSNQSITELDISGNRFTQEVATGFAKVLSTNVTMKILRIGNNLITSAGALALATSINNAQHCEMEELDLTDVPVDYEFLRTTEDVKSTRPNFRVKHGPIMRAGNTLQDISSPAIDVENIKKEPVVLLKIEDAETKDEVHQEDVEKDEVDSLYDQHINKPVKKEDNPEKFHETGLESAVPQRSRKRKEIIGEEVFFFFKRPKMEFFKNLKDYRELPEETLVKIFYYIDKADQIRFSNVCRQFNAIYWKHFKCSSLTLSLENLMKTEGEKICLLISSDLEKIELEYNLDESQSHDYKWVQRKTMEMMLATIIDNGANNIRIFSLKNIAYMFQNFLSQTQWEVSVLLNKVLRSLTKIEILNLESSKMDLSPGFLVIDSATLCTNIVQLNIEKIFQFVLFRH